MTRISNIGRGGSGSNANPGGSNTQIQYNNSNSFDGIPIFIYDSGNSRVELDGILRVKDSIHSKSFDIFQDEFQSRIKSYNTGWVLESSNFSDISIEPSGGNNNGQLVLNTNRVKIVSSKTPLSASASGDTGQICWDSNYIYVCVNSDIWKRSPLSTW